MGSVAQRVEYCRKYRVLPLEDVIVPEPQEAETASFQIPGSGGVEGIAVLSAVDLHHEPAGRAGEVDDVAPDGMLPAELVAHERAIAQVVPELAFRVGHGPAQVARKSGLVAAAHPCASGDSG